MLLNQLSFPSYLELLFLSSNLHIFIYYSLFSIIFHIYNRCIKIFANCGMFIISKVCVLSVPIVSVCTDQGYLFHAPLHIFLYFHSFLPDIGYKIVGNYNWCFVLLISLGLEVFPFYGDRPEGLIIQILPGVVWSRRWPGAIIRLSSPVIRPTFKTLCPQ